MKTYETYRIFQCPRCTLFTQQVPKNKVMGTCSFNRLNLPVKDEEHDMARNVAPQCENWSKGKCKK